MPDPLDDVGGNPDDKKPVETPPKTEEKTDLSSLEELKGKTLDDDTFASLTEMIEKLNDSTADSRVTAAQKKWQKDLDKKLATGELQSAEDVSKAIDKRLEELERKNDARNQLIDTLSEFGIKAKKGDKKYDEFTKAYQDGLDKGHWTAAILVTAAGVKTVIQASGLNEKEDKGAEDRKARRTNPQEHRVRPKGDKEKDVETPSERRQRLMREATGDE